MGGKGSGPQAAVYRIGNQEKTIEDWAKFYGKPLALVRQRMYKLGWSLEEALETPKIRRAIMLTVGNVTKSLAGWAKHTGLPVNTIKARHQKGLTPEQIIAPPRGSVMAWGRRRPRSHWAAEKNMLPSTVYYRIVVLKIPPEVALTMPLAKTGKKRKREK
jgi:hypothetical protein